MRYRKLTCESCRARQQGRGWWTWTTWRAEGEAIEPCRTCGFRLSVGAEVYECAEYARAEDGPVGRFMYLNRAGERGAEVVRLLSLFPWSHRAEPVGWYIQPPTEVVVRHVADTVAETVTAVSLRYHGPREGVDHGAVLDGAGAVPVRELVLILGASWVGMPAGGVVRAAFDRALEAAP